MELYMAVNLSTGEVRVFLSDYEIREFAKEQEYGYEYFEISGANQLYYSDLMRGE